MSSIKSDHENGLSQGRPGQCGAITKRRKMGLVSLTKFSGTCRTWCEIPRRSAKAVPVENGMEKQKPHQHWLVCFLSLKNKKASISVVSSVSRKSQWPLLPNFRRLLH